MKIGANLFLSYRFAPISYRYGLSTVYEEKRKIILTAMIKTAKMVSLNKNIFRQK